MSAISDFFNKVLGKQDECITAVGSIAKDFEALKAVASEKDAKILELSAALEVSKAEAEIERTNSHKFEADLAAEKLAHKATADSTEKQAAAKAAAITQSLGQPPVESAPNPTPAADKKDLSHLKGLDRVKADINRQLGITK